MKSKIKEELYIWRSKKCCRCSLQRTICEYSPFLWCRGASFDLRYSKPFGLWSGTSTVVGHIHIFNLFGVTDFWSGTSTIRGIGRRIGRRNYWVFLILWVLEMLLEKDSSSWRWFSRASCSSSARWTHRSGE